MEIEVERIVLREPEGGPVRAVLETAPPREPGEGCGPVVRLSLLTPRGELALVAEVDETGEPRLFVGHPDRGTTVVITPDAVDLWAGGNIVAAVRSTTEGGRVEVRGADGTESSLP